MTNTTKPALSASPVAQEPAWRYEIQHGPDGETDWAWVYDAENNLVCTAKTYHAAAIVRASAPPATPAGLGADEIARVFARWKNSKNLHESLAAQNIEKELLALLSRAGDQGNSTQKDTSSSAVTSSLSDLIARLEKAQGPDRELDADIALQFDWTECPGDNWIGPQGEIAVPAYTSSIDAAMTLRPAGANCSGFDDGPDICDAYWSRNNVKDGHWLVTAEGKTPALALCIAALRARSLPAI